MLTQHGQMAWQDLIRSRSFEEGRTELRTVQNPLPLLHVKKAVNLEDGEPENEADFEAIEVNWQLLGNVILSQNM